MSNVTRVKLDSEEIAEVASVLRSYRKTLLPTAIAQAMKKLAWDLEPMIQKDFAYEGYVPGEGATPDVIVAPVVHKDGMGFTIHVQGEQVGFLEFGTGMYSDTSHPMAKEAPFVVEPGSWSMTEGAGTWADYEDTPEKYPYNRHPKYGLLHAAQYIQEHYEDYIVDAIRRIAL